ncbi:hypothetical protein GHT06_011624 [Daphnia sinensis]|uniref:Uncharacterized protein n=1 Tax=Daphnia sinensis TaxID=1820382 RepID=A0AAD5KU73_9CRUS|nr:hypothetical protein GHT06_011624 [Daphnia sinensis]
MVRAPRFKRTRHTHTHRVRPSLLLLHKQHTPKRLLLLYECIYCETGSQLVCQCQSNHPKSQLQESCENATLRHAETIEFLLLGAFSCGGSSSSSYSSSFFLFYFLVNILYIRCFVYI